MRNRPTLGWLLILLAPLLVLGGQTARGGEPDIERRKREVILKAKVGRAIDRGVLWLAEQQRPDGSFHLEGNNQQGPFPTSRHRFGESALATLTLAHGGFGPDKTEIKKAVSYLRKHYRSCLKGDYWPQASSYSLSILVLALHELYAEDPSDDLDDDRARYGDSIRARKNPCRYPTWVWKVIERILDWLLENRAEAGLFRYPGGLEGSGGAPPGGPAGGPGGPAGMPPSDHHGPEDLSNAQYVLLALWAGTRCGYEIEKEVLEAMARRLLAWQEKDGRPIQRVLDPDPETEQGTSRYGDTRRPKDVRDRARGFGYTPLAPVTGSMTTAGLSSLAIVKAVLQETHGLDPDLRKEIDRGIWDAIAWLVMNYTLDGNPLATPGGMTQPSPMWHYYYLYGLERAGVIAGKRYFGDHDWYTEGAELLVEAQKKGGSWSPTNFLGGWAGPGPGPGGPPAYDMTMLDTCFAILFLKRAALVPKQPILPEPVITEGD